MFISLHIQTIIRQLLLKLNLYKCCLTSAKKWKKQNLYKISSYMNKIFYNSITQKYIQLVKGRTPLSSKNLNIVILIDIILRRYNEETKFPVTPSFVLTLTWLRGFQDKRLYLVVFSLYPSLFWELGDKTNLKNLQFWPESLGAMLEYWYIERGLLDNKNHRKFFEIYDYSSEKTLAP